MASEKTSKKNKTKPVPTVLAVALIAAAIVMMASFIYYVVTPPKNASAGGDYSGSQDFGEQSGDDYNLELGETKSHIKEADVLDVITFGQYEQDGNRDNGKEEIEWIVLAKDDETALLLSRKALDTVKFNEARESCTFEDSTVFKFLNVEFYDNAFNEDEKAIFSESESKVSLLTKEEAIEYLSVDEAHVDRALITAYAESKGARTRNGACWWWLKDGGNSAASAKYVHFDGTVQDNGFAFDYDEVAIRPVISVKIS